MHIPLKPCERDREKERVGKKRGRDKEQQMADRVLEERKREREHTELQMQWDALLCSLSQKRKEMMHACVHECKGPTQAHKLSFLLDPAISKQEQPAMFLTECSKYPTCHHALRIDGTLILTKLVRALKEYTSTITPATELGHLFPVIR